MKPVAFLYLPAVDDTGQCLERLSVTEQGTALVLGEYGLLNPLAIMHELKSSWEGDIYLELTAAGKNRDLIKSYLVSAAQSGFAGVVLASGLFTIAPGMGKPVFDLDPAQMLKLALDLKTKAVIPENFIIAVRAPEGGEAALARARFFLENGADLAVYKNAPPEALKDHAALIRNI